MDRMRFTWRGLSQAAALLLLAGCTTVPRPEPQSLLRPPETWSAPRPSLSDATPVSTDAWFARIAPEHLPVLLDEALRTTPDLHAASARMRQAQALRRVTASSRRPPSS